MTLKDSGEGKLDSIPDHQLHMVGESKSSDRGWRKEVVGNPTRQAISGQQNKTRRKSRITGRGPKGCISYSAFWPTTAAGTMPCPTVSSTASLSFSKLWPTTKIHWQNRRDSVWDILSTFQWAHSSEHSWKHPADCMREVSLELVRPTGQSEKMLGSRLQSLRMELDG